MGKIDLGIGYVSKEEYNLILILNFELNWICIYIKIKIKQKYHFLRDFSFLKLLHIMISY